MNKFILFSFLLTLFGCSFLLKNEENKIPDFIIEKEILWFKNLLPKTGLDIALPFQSQPIEEEDSEKKYLEDVWYWWN